MEAGKSAYLLRRPLTSGPGLGLAAPGALASPALPGFKAYALDPSTNPVPANRLDYYKVCLISGHIVVQFAGRHRELNGTHLLFAGPHVSYSTLLLSARVTGYVCLFNEEFVRRNGWIERLPESGLFRSSGVPVYRLADEQATHSTSVFEQMLAAQQSDYPFKREPVSSYLQLLMHEGMRA